MSGIFKSLRPKDKITVPYLSNKRMYTSFDVNESSSLAGIKIYDSEYAYSSSYNFLEQGVVSLDDGNNYYDQVFETTTDGYYKTSIHSQIDHLYYKYYLDNNSATVDRGNINYQYRDIGYKARIVGVSSMVAGEGIRPGSLQITGSTYTIKDDANGNLILRTDTGLSAIQPELFDNVLCSYTFNKYYKLADEGLASFQEVATYGYKRLRPTYLNIGFIKSDNNGSIAATFTRASNSEIKLEAVENSNVRDMYNFQNGDYSIAFRAMVGDNGGGVLLSKQEPALDWHINDIGVFTANTAASNQYPYKISIQPTTNKIVFTKTNTSDTLSIVSSAALVSNAYKNVVIQRTGSLFEIYINGALDTSQTDIFYNNTPCSLLDRDCSNQSNLTVGNDYTLTNGYSGSIDYMHIFDRALTLSEIQDLNLMNGGFNRFCGNVFYNTGMIALTHPRVTTKPITAMNFESTKTIYETSVFCTVGPGDYNVTYNKSVWGWNTINNQYEIACRYTGSEFRPYVTSIGLYDDSNNLVAVAKLSTPIQTSRTTDTTFVVKYDR